MIYCTLPTRCLSNGFEITGKIIELAQQEERINLSEFVNAVLKYALPVFFPD